VRFHPKKSLKKNIILHLFIYFKDDLARIGYILYMKKKKKPELFYLLGYLLLELIIRIWQFGFYFLRNLGKFRPFSP